MGKINCFKGGPRNKYTTDITAVREPLVNDTGKAYTLLDLQKLRCPDDRACLLLGFATVFGRNCCLDWPCLPENTKSSNKVLYYKCVSWPFFFLSIQYQTKNDIKQYLLLTNFFNNKKTIKSDFQFLLLQLFVFDSISIFTFMIFTCCVLLYCKLKFFLRIVIVY